MSLQEELSLTLKSRFKLDFELDAQWQTFPPYVHENTMKVLVSAMIVSYISFVPAAWAGSASDSEHSRHRGCGFANIHIP